MDVNLERFTGTDVYVLKPKRFTGEEPCIVSVRFKLSELDARGGQ